MQQIFNNKKLLTYFSDKNSLLDGKIEKIEIFGSDSSLSIYINYEMRPSSSCRKIQLQFAQCKSYSFSYSDDYYFYNVESFKFFMNENGLFYISFDPVDESESISNEDQDFILCKEVSAYHI